MRQDRAIVVIGATGYTGRLVARTIAREAQAGSAPFDGRLVLAARDAGRLEALAGDLDAGITELVDVTDPASLHRLIRAGDAVINTAGPFTELGEPVVRACIEEGAHYLDTTGEQPWMRRMHLRHNAAARSAGVAVVNAMAFEYALGDCALSLAVRELGAPVRSADVIYAWGGTATSAGTRRTVLRMLGRRGWVRRDGGFELQASGSGHRRVRLRSGVTLDAVAFPSGEVVTAPRQHTIDTVRGWLVMGSRAARLTPLLAPALPVLVPVLRPLVEPLVTRGPDPTPAQREASRFTIRVELEATDGRRHALEVHGRDPYGLTALIAARGARRTWEPGAPAGVIAPSELVEPGAFLASLSTHGVRLVRDPDSPVG
ncbi:MAG: saccharopine dehydrogenase family protein [Gemmatimonadota bacterium]